MVLGAPSDHSITIPFIVHHHDGTEHVADTTAAVIGCENIAL